MSSDDRGRPDASGRRKRNNGQKLEKATPNKSRKPAKQAAVATGAQVAAERPVIALPVPKQPDVVLTGPVNAAPARSIAPEAPAPAPAEALAKEYAVYFETSVQQVRSFCEQFAKTTSMGKAIELHTDFLKQGLDSLMESSQNIRELHRQVVRQEVTHLQRCVASFVQAALEQPAPRH